LFRNFERERERETETERERKSVNKPLSGICTCNFALQNVAVALCSNLEKK